MIIVYHQNNLVTKVVSPNNELVAVDVHSSIASVLVTLSYQFPQESIVWCHELLGNSLNIEGIATLFHHNKMMLSFDRIQIIFLMIPSVMQRNLYSLT